MNDIFQQEIAKITKMEKLIKTDLSSWEDLTTKNIALSSSVFYLVL